MSRTKETTSSTERSNNTYSKTQKLYKNKRTPLEYNSNETVSIRNGVNHLMLCDEIEMKVIKFYLAMQNRNSN
jgi:hypothetical protein